MNRVLRAVDAVNRRHPWSHNDHYRRWVLRQIPAGTQRALDVGCGTGTLLRALANLLVGPLRSRGAGAARVAMSAPTAPATESLAEIRAAVGAALPGAAVRRRLFWRYTLTWTAPR